MGCGPASGQPAHKHDCICMRTSSLQELATCTQARMLPDGPFRLQAWGAGSGALLAAAGRMQPVAPHGSLIASAICPRSSLVEDTSGKSVSRGPGARIWPWAMGYGIPINCDE